MMRRIAVVGDVLMPDGGSIQPYQGRPASFGGHQPALIGGQAYCAACKSIGIIAKTGGPRRMQFMGEIALDGDIVLCRCAASPRIHAVLAGEKWYEDMGGGEGGAPVVSPAQDIFPASNPRYNQQIQLVDETTGKPLVRTRYRLIGDAGTFDGRTDDNGMTERVASDGASTMTLEIFGEGT